MKTKRNFALYTFLLLFLCGSAITINAQPNSGENTALGVGDHIPNIVVSNLYHSPNASLLIEDLYKDGGLIINFWATWCAPCISELKMLNKILFGYENLRILAVTYEDRQTVSNFLRKNPDLNPELLNITYEETSLHSLFPHNTVPHVVWIDRDGKIKAISGSQDVSIETIERFLEGKDFEFLEKIEEHFDFTQPMFVPDSLIQYRSFFHGHRNTINSGGFLVDTKRSIKKSAMRRFYGWNVNAKQLFWEAYDRGDRVNHYLLELITRDSMKFFFPEERDSTIFANSKYASATGKKWPDDWKVLDAGWMKARQYWAEENLYN